MGTVPKNNPNDYPVGSIGYSWAMGESAGAAAWLAGIPFEECPYVKYEETLEKAGWLFGWTLAQDAYIKLEHAEETK